MRRNNNCLLGSSNRRWHKIYARYLVVSNPNTKTNSEDEPGGVSSSLIPVKDNAYKLGDENHKWDYGAFNNLEAISFATSLIDLYTKIPEDDNDDYQKY